RPRSRRSLDGPVLHPGGEADHPLGAARRRASARARRPGSRHGEGSEGLPLRRHAEPRHPRADGDVPLARRRSGQHDPPIVENRAMSGGWWWRVSWTIALLAAMAGCRGPGPAPVPPSNDHWLVVWAEDVDRTHSDFLAVLGEDGTIVR